MSKVDEVIHNIEKRFGKGSVISFTEEEQFNIKRVSTGSLGLDLATGGGWPKGRIIEIYGPESSGKTTLALHAIAEVQKQGGLAAYIDSEHSFDPIYAENLGISLDKEKFLFSQPTTGEEALGIAEELLKIKEVQIIVFDSVAAMIPLAELEGDFGESKMGLHARLMSQGMRKLTGMVSKSECCMIFINQLRDKIGVMFGNPETTTGGNALKFYASIRCDIRRKEIVKDKENQAISNRVKVKVVKNKTYPPFKECEFLIEYGRGISVVDEVLNIAIESGIIQQKGSWFSYEESKLGQGRDNLPTLMEDNPTLFEEIKQKVLCLYQ